MTSAEKELEQCGYQLFDKRIGVVSTFDYSCGEIHIEFEVQDDGSVYVRACHKYIEDHHLYEEPRWLERDELSAIGHRFQELEDRIFLGV